MTDVKTRYDYFKATLESLGNALAVSFQHFKGSSSMDVTGIANYLARFILYGKIVLGILKSFDNPKS